MSLKELAKYVMENHASSFVYLQLAEKFDRGIIDQFLEKYATYNRLTECYYPHSIQIYEDFFNLDFQIVIDNDRPITSAISINKAKRLLEEFQRIYPDNSFTIEPIR